jgi:hypothetical protein
MLCPASFQGRADLQIFHLNLPSYGTGNHLELAALDDLAQAEHPPPMLILGLDADDSSWPAETLPSERLPDYLEI